ncbi:MULTISPECIES: histidine phosphatase family protein [Streptomyces]|uniref:Histidine phosphatase family protein n=1 Tax=Streptomyces lienomycini TaxID=284035 RepID=A0ABV9WND0_9ACTN|nr:MULTISPECIES: histidine phosphatase family protein [Streptomyces]
MRLLLIRHGQTPSNLKHLLDTAEPGPGLTALGQEQAAALPAALESEKIDALYASTLVRTQLTAAPLAAATGLEVRIRAGIRELTAGDLEMRGDDEAAHTYLHTAFAWSAGDVRLRMPGGENGEEALGRFDAVVAEAHGSGAQTVAMISHGAAIRMWVAARADNVDVAHAAQHALANTGIVVLTGSPEGGWRTLLWEGESLGPVPGTPGPDDPTGAAIPTP